VSNVLIVSAAESFEFVHIRRVDVGQYYGGEVLKAFEMGIKGGF
jgi:hypothetical protein